MKTPSTLVVILIAGSALLASSARAAQKPAKLLPLYEKVSAALVTDNLADAQATACALAVESTQLRQTDVAENATAVGKAADLAAARAAFKGLSRAIIPLARQLTGYFIINCPMAKADWVQDSRSVANPYLGKDMSMCGTVTEETKG